MDLKRIEEGTRVTLTLPELAYLTHRPSSVANPGPLGLAGFALTTFVLSVFNTGLPDKSLEAVVLPLALFYGGLAQLIAGIWEFKVPNAFGATAFISYGSFWMSFAWYVKYEVPHLDPTKVHVATGLFLLAWTIFTLYMLIASCRTTVAVFMVFFLLELAFLLLTIGALGNVKNCTKAGGWIGIMTAVAAWYASAALVINNTWQTTVLPIGELIKAAPMSEGPSEKKQEIPSRSSRSSPASPVITGYPTA